VVLRGDLDWIMMKRLENDRTRRYETANGLARDLQRHLANEQEIDSLFARLSEGGQVMMPLGSYGFSRKFAWVSDLFGVSWQLNLA
jgi:uncharacterized glyoxalase superfamily protein PhnB